MKNSRKKLNKNLETKDRIRKIIIVKLKRELIPHKHK